MKKALLAALYGVLLIFITGCMFGDSVTLRKVSLKLTETGSKTKVSVDDAEAQEAIRIIDGVLTARGFHNNPITAEDQARGVVAFYGICGVTLASNRLDIGFAESYRRASSAPVKSISGELRDKLGERFGVQNVRVTQN